MSERVTLETTPDGRLVAVKHSRSHQDHDRLRREAELLDAARHPGVVELVRLDERDLDDVRLVTIAAPGGPLALLPRPDVPGVAALAAVVATTLADLHLHGIVHGRIDGSHVLVDHDGRPVLCGFADACTDRDEASPPDDVAGLGRLVLDLLGPSTTAEPIPDLRRRLGRRSSRWTGYQQRALLTLADQASADDPRHRPSARAFAAALSAAFPDATLPGTGTGTDREARTETDADTGDAGTAPGQGERRDRSSSRSSAVTRHARAVPRPGRRAVVAAGALLVGVVGLTSLAAGTATIRGGERPSVVAGDASDPITGVAASAATERAPTTAPTDAPSASTTSTTVPCLETDGPVADLDGDGCAAALHVDGTVVQGDGGRFEVGEPGDLVLVGDWDCDGTATPAVVRPEVGEVFVFSRWARAGADLTVEAADEVPGATGAEVRSEGDCDRLVVTAPDGEHDIDLEALAPGEVGTP